jgi:hypothetical protein
VSSPSRTTGATAEGTAATVDPTPPQVRRTPRLVAALVAALAVGGGAIFMLRSQQAPARAPEPAARVDNTPVPAVTDPAEAARKTEIALVLRAQPSEAKLFLGDEPLAGNPAVKRILKDGSTQIVRAEAKGYVTRTIDVTLDADKDVTLTLEKASTPAAAAPLVAARPAVAAFGARAKAPTHTSSAAHPAAPAPSPTNTPAAAPADKPLAAPAGKKPTRPVDSNNPWEK